MPNIFYICGTDTNVGKTLTLGAILAHLNFLKKDFYFAKPFESGVTRSDTDFLCKMSGNRFKLDEVNYHYFPLPLAPGVAAKLSHKKIDFEKVVQRIKNESQKQELTFVEGAGGLLVPLTEKKTNLDLIKALNAKVILVSRLELGTINHTRLTYDRLRLEGIDVVGVILNQTQEKKTVASQTNPDVLKTLKIPILGIMPFIKKKTAEELRSKLPLSIKNLF